MSRFQNSTKKISFRKNSKKFVTVQVSTISLNQKRSNTYNQSIKNKIVTQNILVKLKMSCL